MTRDQIRGFIDRLGVSSRIDDDGDIAVTLTADNDFGHNVTIWVMIGDERRLAFIGSADNYHPDGDLLFLANRSNDMVGLPRPRERDNRRVILILVKSILPFWRLRF